MSIELEPSDPKWGSFRPDARKGNHIIVYEAGNREIRRFRDTLTQLAVVLSCDPVIDATLLLEDPKISNDRIHDEKAAFLNILRPEIASRLNVAEVYGVADNEEDPSKLPGTILGEPVGMLLQTLRHHDYDKIKGRPDAFSTILKILLLRWIRGKGPITSSELGQLANCSYPTIKSARGKLEKYLKDDPHRGVELRRFPESAWRKLLADSEELRQTRRFVSAAPRPVLKNVEKATKLSSNQYAIGGIIGARHHLPGIDLVGEPRLDLIAFQQSDREIDKSIAKIDPSLQLAETGQAAQVAVHRLYREESYFDRDKENRTVADEVECLLDLHDAQLDL